MKKGGTRGPVLRRPYRPTGPPEFLRIVKETRQDGRTVLVLLDCGHCVRIVRDDDYVWEDEIPGWIDCPGCEANATTNS